MYSQNQHEIYSESIIRIDVLTNESHYCFLSVEWNCIGIGIRIRLRSIRLLY